MSLTFLLLPLVGLPLAAQDLPTDAPANMAEIDREDLKAHATHLASDELGGRHTGSPGQVAAAEYIAAHFEKLGFEPLGDKKGGKRTYFQHWPVECTRLESKNTGIKFGKHQFKRGFAIVRGKERDRIRASGKFVFCGKGAAKDIPARLRGSIPVLQLGGTDGPRAGMRASLDVRRVSQIASRAADRGAQVLVVAMTEISATADNLNYAALLPDVPRLRFEKERTRSAPPMAIPVMYVSPEVSEALFEHMGVEQGEQKDPRARGKVDVHVVDEKRFTCMNVCAVLRGSDRTLADEAVVFSAHMDHMGTRLDGDAFNGADDNASGTSGLLDIAQAFSKGPVPPRSIVFLSVSGEELGLWGSKYYSEHPTWNAKKIVADINIDMIGRATQLSGASGISVTPSHRHDKFSTLVQTAARCADALDLSLSSGDIYYERSDHYHFAKLGIPVVFFCDGEHEDYHKVTDTPDKLDYEKMERVARLAFWTGQIVAHDKRRPRDVGAQPGWLPSDN